MNWKMISLLACLIGSTAQANGILPFDDPDRVANGQELYAQTCAACHGANLEGEKNWQLRDADGYLPAPPHDETGHTWHHADELLIQITAYGTEALVGGTYKSNMIGFSDILTDREILDVLAFIKSTWPAEIIQKHNEINSRVVRQRTK